MAGPSWAAGPPRLQAHLAGWLGAWPPRKPLRIVGAVQREVAGWDGQLHPALGVASPGDGAVLSVQGRHALAVRLLAADASLAEVLTGLPAAIGQEGRGTFEAVFRWTTAPEPLTDAGDWLDADDPDVPAWLRPFGGEVLTARDPYGRYLAGVGIKRHDRYGHELAVVTEPAARGRGLARRLVAQAARRVLDFGAVPTYQHDPANSASAAVALAAGFPDRGWTSFGLAEAGPDRTGTAQPEQPRRDSPQPRQQHS
jgi:GNAT superfamily N-acetyltransferase